MRYSFPVSSRRVLLWILLFVVVAVTTFELGRYRKRENDMVDFEVYRTAGERIEAAAPLYRPEDGHYQFKYLPAFALFAIPFTWPPRAVAEALWFALSFILLVVFVRRAVRTLPNRRLSDRVLMWAAVLLLGRFYVKELVLGQANLLLAVVVLAALVAVQQKRPIAAGVLVGIAVFIKPYALVLVPWLAIAAGPASLVAVAAITAAGLLMPAIVYGWHGNLDQVIGWYRTVTDTTEPNLLIAENVSLATMWAKWIGAGSTASLLATLTALLALATAAAMWLRRRSVAEPAYLEFAALTLLIPLLSPQGWDYLLLFGTPAVLVLVDRFTTLSRPWRVIVGLSLVQIGFTIYDLIGRRTYLEFMALSITTVCALALVAGLSHLRWRALA